MSAGFIAVVRNWTTSDFKYFTVWGVTITELYFCLVMGSYVINSIRGGGKERDPHSPIRMWKFVSVFFQMALLWEVIITCVYWTILWPFETHPEGTKFTAFWHTSLVHLLPVIYLIVEYIFNRIYFEWHQLWV
jgi:hypothetical protein